MPDTLDTLHALDVPTATTIALVRGGRGSRGDRSPRSVVASTGGSSPTSRLPPTNGTATSSAAASLAAGRGRAGWPARARSLLVLVLPGVGVADLGLRLPDLGGLVPDGGTDDAVAMVVGAAVGVALTAGALALLIRRSSAAGRGPSSPRSTSCSRPPRRRAAAGPASPSARA